MQASRRTTLLALALLSAPASAAAQRFPGSDAMIRSGIGLELMAGYGLMAGEVGDSVGGGFQVEGAAFYQPRGSQLRFGAGGGYSWYGFDRTDGSLDKVGLFGVATLLIPSAETKMIPYVQARVGWTQLTDDQGCGPDYELQDEYCGGDFEEIVPGSRTRSGLELGAAVGVDIPVSPKISLDVAGTFTWLSMGEYDFEGTTLPFTDASGSAFAIRGGVIYFLAP